MTTSVGPIPLATMTNRDWSHTGQNYLKSLFALAFQAFLIMVCVGIYSVLVQGIADVVLVFDDHAEILDYKTDKSRNATYYIESYAAQLRLYRRAFALRLPVPVTKLTIYSFAMQDEIDIPLEYAAFGIGDKLLGR